MEYVVVSRHRSGYPDPVRLRPGDPVTLGRRDQEYPGWIWVTDPSGRQGWAPESLLRIGAAERGTATTEYTARELNVEAGDRVTGETELAGWLWVRNEQGNAGWVPREKVKAV